MFLHAGGSAVVRGRDIIGIFDLDGKITTPDTADFLRRAERGGETELAGGDLPKCFVLVVPPKRGGRRTKTQRNKQHVVFSHISANALAGRAEFR